MNTLQTPSVAIFMVTYNHEKYIRQAVKSIVEQKTNFPYMLFIGEDCSTDNTRSICIELQQKYPEKITLLLHEKNIGALQNAAQVYKACVEYGKYTAICEGDDYWTDKNKLQKQVDFLEQNPDFNICCHRAMYLNEKTKVLKPPKALKHSVFTQEDVANHNFVQTLTEVFRNSAWKGLPKEYFNSISGDYFVNMMLSENGKIKYLPDVMAVYRQQQSGSWHSLDAIKGIQNTLSILNYYLQTDLKDSVKENLKKNIVRQYLRLYEMEKNKEQRAKNKDVFTESQEPRTKSQDIFTKNKEINILESQQTTTDNQQPSNILSSIFSPDFLSALDAELIKFIEQQNCKEAKVGRILLKPYYSFRKFLSKINFYIHRIKYE